MTMKSGKQTLTSLKCLLFCFFGGIGCLFPFLPTHIRKVGLTTEEGHIVSIVAPFVAILGPLIAGPIADKLGARNNGGSLRAMLAITMILSAISYSLLLAIPAVDRYEARRPAVSFTCDDNGANVLQERCMEKSSCYQWTEQKIGPLLLNDCRYDCHSDALALDQDPDENITDIETTLIPITTNAPVDDFDVNNSSGEGPMEVDITNTDGDQDREKRHSISLTDDTDPPHLCFRDNKGHVLCHVYTESSETISVNASLLQAHNPVASRQEWCKYPLGGDVWCRIPPSLLTPMGHEICRVVCSLDEPYSTVGSVLAQSQCQRIVGDPTITFWSYLVVRSVADIFPSAAVALLNTAIVIAARETCVERLDTGRQLAFGFLGASLFAPIVGYLSFNNVLNAPENPTYLIAFAGFAIMMVISALIAIFSTSMPIGAPEWWWTSTRISHISIGRKWKTELAGLMIVLVLLGIFFSALDSYLPWHLTNLRATSFLIGLTLTIGGVPSIPLLWCSECIIDYCGHSNLLITAFTFYIIRYTGLSFFTQPYGPLVLESLEMFTLSIMWVTAMSYVRHLVPRHRTSTGQAAAVIAHFCIGRCVGAIMSGCLTSWSDSMIVVYRTGAMAAAIIATAYFILYHCCFKQRCLAPSNPSGQRDSPVAQGGQATNGSYTPHRVQGKGIAEALL